MSDRIVINNQEFASPDDMPPDVRRIYDEAVARMGRSDAAPSSAGDRVIKATHTTITVNGKTYGSVAEMPDDVRQQYQAALVSAGIGAEQPASRPQQGVHLDLSSGGKPAGQRAMISFDIAPGGAAIIVAALIAALVAWFVLHG
jgi:hypothetical protein